VSPGTRSTGDKGPNWGRWGADDERGTANLLSREYVSKATAGPFAGDVFPLGVTVGGGSPSYGRRAPLHMMSVDGGDYAALDRLDGFGFTDDYLVMACHSSTHIDALSHVLSDGAMYNGHSWREVRSSGARRCAVDAIGAIVARAHLLDIAGHRGVASLEPGEVVEPDELEAVRAAAGAEIQPGDAVLVRTGFITTLLEQPSRVGSEPGLAPACAEWIAAHDISVLGADNSAVEVQGEEQVGAPLHEAVVVALGCYLMELLDLERPAAQGVTEGLLVVSPLKIARGVGSPVNPVLIV
jgi:kynurenine formamidase